MNNDDEKEINIMDKSGLVRTKPRGLKRRCEEMVRDTMRMVEVFPCEDWEDCGDWHDHIQASQTFTDSKHTPKSVRKLCLQTLINSSVKLYENKPQSDDKIRIVVRIFLPIISDSNVRVLFNDKRFNEIMEIMNKDEWKTISLPSTRNIVKEWGLRIPKQYEVKGYREEIHYPDEDRVGEIWQIGELS